jgi:glucan phosphoethanolaminetransferase (alkaline phosphatase superfamily)
MSWAWRKVLKPTEPGATEPEGKTPTLDAIIEEILRGERIVFFPPGSLVFICANFAALFGSALLFVSTLQSVFSTSIPETAVMQLAGIAGAVLLTVIPGMLVALGVTRGRQIALLTVQSLLACTVLTLASALFGIAVSLTACLIAAVLLGSAHAMIQSVGYGTYALFQLRLRQRRAKQRMRRPSA